MVARIASKNKKRVWAALEREGRAGLCHYCGTHIARGLPDKHPNLATLDHVVPRSRGGSNCIPNLVAACFSCNNRRGDADEFVIGYRDSVRASSPFDALRSVLICPR